MYKFYFLSLNSNDHKALIHIVPHDSIIQPYQPNININIKHKYIISFTNTKFLNQVHDNSQTQNKRILTSVNHNAGNQVKPTPGLIQFGPVRAEFGPSIYNYNCA